MGIGDVFDGEEIVVVFTSRTGLGTGVGSVDGVTSTSSASRYHFLRRV